jgi:ring-1,2-phenylacetyl-CoA epoxidase subunit PaaD
MSIATRLDARTAWEVLGRIPDPEIPVISVTELGIVRAVRCDGTAVEVVVTPTYSGCPATEMIERSIRAALTAAGASSVTVKTQLAPPWTTDWIDARARARLHDYGIAPPGAPPAEGEQTMSFTSRNERPRIDCPRCGSRDTERLSQFGATPCKALYRCRACREPFEYFKPL